MNPISRPGSRTIPSLADSFTILTPSRFTPTCRLAVRCLPNPGGLAVGDSGSVFVSPTGPPGVPLPNLASLGTLNFPCLFRKKLRPPVTAAAEIGDLGILKTNRPLFLFTPVLPQSRSQRADARFLSGGQGYNDPEVSQAEQGKTYRSGCPRRRRGAHFSPFLPHQPCVTSITD